MQLPQPAVLFGSRNYTRQLINYILTLLWVLKLQETPEKSRKSRLPPFLPFSCCLSCCYLLSPMCYQCAYAGNAGIAQITISCRIESFSRKKWHGVRRNQQRIAKQVMRVTSIEHTHKRAQMLAFSNRRSRRSGYSQSSRLLRCASLPRALWSAAQCSAFVLGADFPSAEATQSAVRSLPRIARRARL